MSQQKCVDEYDLIEEGRFFLDHGGDIDIILPVLRAWAVVSDAEFERVAAALKTISNVMKIQGET
jgi:hypothetical protein